MNVLIADPDSVNSSSIKKFLSQNNMQVSLCSTGKDCQLLAYRDKFDCVILDVSIQNYSYIEVLRYLKVNQPSASIVLVIPENSEPTNYGLSDDKIKKIGVIKVLKKPLDEREVLEALKRNSTLERWKELTSDGKKDEKEELDTSDDEFSKIHISHLLMEDITIVDFYLKMSAGKYLKLFSQGSHFNEEDLKKYHVQKGLEFLYFKNSDRGVYINYVNDCLEGMLTSNKPTPSKAFKNFEDVIDKYLGEVYSSGINPTVVDEGVKICKNMLKLVNRERDASKLLKSMQDIHYPEYSLQFLTAFYATLISQGLEWSSSRTTEQACMGSFLHMIGMLSLPEKIRLENLYNLSDDELNLYRQYPLKGVIMLENFNMITEPVKQIVFQHREFNDGTGFPNNLNGSQIYPLAKIVGISHAFSTLIIKDNLKPIDALNEFSMDRTNLLKFDAQLIRILITSFIAKRVNRREVI